MNYINARILRSPNYLRITCLIIIILYSIWYIRNKLVFNQCEPNIQEHLYLFQKLSKDYIEDESRKTKEVLLQSMEGQLSHSEFSHLQAEGKHVFLHGLKKRR